LTAGLDAWILCQHFSPDAARLEAEVHLTGCIGASAVVLATMKAAREYRVAWNGKPVSAVAGPSGTLQIPLPAGNRGYLSVESVD
jgi:hypothetical protein